MKQIIFLSLLLLLFGCKKKEHILNSDGQLLSMKFDFGEVAFDSETNEGTIEVPENTDLTKLIPEIEISDGATIYPPSGVATDFSEGVTYTVDSEDKSNKNIYSVSAFLPIIKFQVYDATDCNESDPNPVIAPGTTLSLYTEPKGKDVLFKELESDKNGEALFYGKRDSVYYLQADNSGAKNIFKHYIIAGVFQTQEQLDAYSYLSPNARLGDLLLLDLNFDGQLSHDDFMDYQPVYNDNEEGIVTIKIYVSKNRQNHSL